MILKDKTFQIFDKKNIIYLLNNKTKKETLIADLNIETKKLRKYDKEQKKWIDELKVTGKPSAVEVYDGLIVLKQNKVSLRLQEGYVNYCAIKRQEVEDDYAFLQVFKTKELDEL